MWYKGGICDALMVQLPPQKLFISAGGGGILAARASAEAMQAKTDAVAMIGYRSAASERERIAQI
eukprot:scaffold147633_cov35-Tisochrysis_lutea.AAC.2